MLTGQFSSQALQVVQAHTSSGVMRSKSELASMVISPVDADGRRHLRGRRWRP